MKKVMCSTFAVSVSLILGCVSETPEEREKYSCENKMLSYTYARDFIKQKMKSPSSVEFPSFNNVNYTYEGNCRHRISGSVEAQNSFGVMIENNYTITVRYDKPSESYVLEKLNMK